MARTMSCFQRRCALRGSVHATQRAYRARTASVDTATTPLITRRRRRRRSLSRMTRQQTRLMNQIRVNNQLNKSCDQTCDMHSVCSIIYHGRDQFLFFLRVYSNCYNYCDSNYTQIILLQRIQDLVKCVIVLAIIIKRWIIKIVDNSKN